MKLKFSIIALTFALTACDDPNVAQTAKNLNLDLGDIGSNLVVQAVKNECESQLNSQEGVANLVLTDEQQATICTCVSDELKGNLTADKLKEVVKDGKVDTKAMTSMVTRAMAKCTTPTQTTTPADTDKAQL